MNMSLESLESKRQPWLNAQRIGIAAYIVMVAPRLLGVPTQYGSSQKQAERQKFLRNLQLALYTAWCAHFGGQDDGQDQRPRLTQLPPAVLALLDTVLTKAPNNVPACVQRLKEPIKEVLARLDQKGTAQVTVQVVEIAITPPLAPAERLREAETEPLHHGEPLHTRR